MFFFFKLEKYDYKYASYDLRLIGWLMVSFASCVIRWPRLFCTYSPAGRM